MNMLKDEKKVKKIILKDYLNCPFCMAEKQISVTGWGFSPTGWEEVRKRHEEEHTCPTCGK